MRYVLDYAKNMECVLLLDELDAVAKRRDDATEIGELKRLVTVLLQEIDDWPPTGLLVAATNHPQLLDPAVWRRFEIIIDFPVPGDAQVRQSVERSLKDRVSNPNLIDVVSLVLQGLSFSDIDRDLRQAIRQSVMSLTPVDETLRNLVRRRMESLGVEERKSVASLFLNAGFNQRKTHEWTGVHRDTIRKMGEQPEKSPR